MRSRLALLMLLVALLAPSAAGAQSSVREDGHRVAVLNAFADALLAVVARWQASDRVIKTARPGGLEAPEHGTTALHWTPRGSAPPASPGLALWGWPIRTGCLQVRRTRLRSNAVPRRARRRRRG